VHHTFPDRTRNGTGNMSDFDSECFIELVPENSFLYDVKDKKHSNRDIVQKAWEDIAKEMGCEGNHYLIIIYTVITVLVVWNVANFIYNLLW
jgi:hypothetical protein